MFRNRYIGNYRQIYGIAYIPSGHETCNKNPESYHVVWDGGMKWWSHDTSLHSTFEAREAYHKHPFPKPSCQIIASMKQWYS